MTLKSTLYATFATMTFVSAALADGAISIDDAYARSSGKTAKAGAAFMVISNEGRVDDRLIGARSEAAARVELHTHKINDEGVAQMLHVEEGFAIPAGEAHTLQRGGDHVMFMGLTQPFEQGAMVPVTLIFETAGAVEVEIPVDLERQDHGAAGHTHSDHTHSD